MSIRAPRNSLIRCQFVDSLLDLLLTGSDKVGDLLQADVDIHKPYLECQCEPFQFVPKAYAAVTNGKKKGSIWISRSSV
ncbi:MAG: hypothetical protein Q8N45_12170, partial [Anaerolineales bacterium]|nr:hypothetical protein [Anaerolineales bacterium]